MPSVLDVIWSIRFVFSISRSHDDCPGLMLYRCCCRRLKSRGGLSLSLSLRSLCLTKNPLLLHTGDLPSESTSLNAKIVQLVECGNKNKYAAELMQARKPGDMIQVPPPCPLFFSFARMQCALATVFVWEQALFTIHDVQTTVRAIYLQGGTCFYHTTAVLPEIEAAQRGDI